MYLLRLIASTCCYNKTPTCLMRRAHLLNSVESVILRALTREEARNAPLFVVKSARDNRTQRLLCHMMVTHECVNEKNVGIFCFAYLPTYHSSCRHAQFRLLRKTVHNALWLCMYIAKKKKKVHGHRASHFVSLFSLLIISDCYSR